MKIRRKHIPYIAAGSALVLAIVGAVAVPLYLAPPVNHLVQRVMPSTDPATPSEAPIPDDPMPSATPGRTLPDVSSPKVWASWSVLHRDTGAIDTGGEPGTNTTESMIKVGIAADYLHGLEAAGRTPTERETDLLTRMIRVSDNSAAETLYRARGGDALVRRLIQACGLRETTLKPGWWSETQMTAADAARLGGCLADGKVCSPAWMAWVLEQMRAVSGEGRFGVIETRPTDHGQVLAIKNGWTLRGDGWHVNCLAIGAWWTIAVMARYPAELGLVYGAGLCADVAAVLAPPDDANERRPPSPSAGTGAPGGAGVAHD